MRGEVVTGLLYVDAAAEDLDANLGTVDVPLNRLGPAELSPGAAVLEKSTPHCANRRFARQSRLRAVPAPQSVPP